MYLNGRKILTVNKSGGIQQVQSDWNQTDTEAVDYIKNKPTIPAEVVANPTLAGTESNLEGIEISGIKYKAGGGDGLKYELIWENPNDTISSGDAELFDNANFNAKLILVEIINPNKYSTTGDQRTMMLCNLETKGKYTMLTVLDRSGSYGSYTYSIAGMRSIWADNYSTKIYTAYNDKGALGYNNVAVPKRIWKLA